MSEPVKPPDTVITQPETKKDTTITLTLTSKSKKLAIGIAAVVIIAAVFVVLKLLPDDAPELVENRVAVAFFESKTGDESFDYLERMIADNLTKDLGEIKTAEISPLISDEIYRDKFDLDRLQELSKATNAQFIISGSIYKQGSELLIQSRITDLSIVKFSVLCPMLPALKQILPLLWEHYEKRLWGLYIFYPTRATGTLFNLPTIFRIMTLQ